MSLFVILEVERCVKEREVREKTLCGNSACKLKQIVVRIARVEVYAFLNLENVYREDRCFAVSEACFCGKQYVFHNHSALRRGVCAVVQRAKRYLSTCTAVHCVEVVYKSLHSLIASSVGFFFSVSECKSLKLS